MALRMQIRSTYLGPAAGFGNCLDRSNPEAFADASRKHGAHDSKMFVWDLAGCSNLIKLVGKPLHEVPEIIKLLARYASLLQLVNLLS
jgi:hypothetical protein